ncbi:MAG: hypothetical protein DMG58_07235 [Acidobacteria bacterium]|nr:MAG: hypothetical protein DMG58_07235 [Acidobacteriota bacterium]
MQPVTQVAPVSNRALWAGRIISALPVVFLVVDGAMKVMKAPVAVEGSIQLGYPERVVLAIGVVLLVCTLLCIIPRTSILGAILLTGYLGGAIATQVRVGNPLFTHILFPVYVGVMVWGGLFLRDKRLRELIPLRS